MYPFNFNIVSGKKERDRRIMLYSLTAVLLTAAFAAGFIIVYVNSYNMISPEPMEIFSFYRGDGGMGFIFFGHFFRIMG